MGRREEELENKKMYRTENGGEWGEEKRGERTRECREQRTGEWGEEKRGERTRECSKLRRVGRSEEGREQESGEKNPETRSQARAMLCLRSPSIVGHRTGFVNVSMAN